jgi:hypothetical protein
MEFLNDYLVLAVVGVCLCIGYIIKHVIPTDKINKFIPLIVGILGVVVNVWMNNWGFTPEILLGGLVSGLASTGMYELFAQFIKKTDTAE